MKDGPYGDNEYENDYVQIGTKLMAAKDKKGAHLNGLQPWIPPAF